MAELRTGHPLSPERDQRAAKPEPEILEQIVTPQYNGTKAPADYTAGEILRAIEGSVARIPCLGSETNDVRAFAVLGRAG